MIEAIRRALRRNLRAAGIEMEPAPARAPAEPMWAEAAIERRAGESHAAESDRTFLPAERRRAAEPVPIRQADPRWPALSGGRRPVPVGRAELPDAGGARRTSGPMA